MDAPPQRYETLARFDLVGNKTRSVDGNHHETRMEYDFANRLVRTVDPVGREERREYDLNGNPKVERWLAGGIEQRRRTTRYDGLNRPFEVKETFKSLGNATDTYESRMAYADAQNAVATKDARGFLTVVLKDDLDRTYQQTVDAASEPSGTLGRTPDDSSVGSALGLTTRLEYDSHGNLAAQVDALNRRTEEKHDALGRLLERRKPMSVIESFVYDGEGHAIQQTDGRGIVRTTGYDVAGRPALERLVESISSGGTPLTTLERLYLDTPDIDTGLVRVVERDARTFETIHVQDGLHREVRVQDALNHVRESRFDAQNLRVARDAKGHTTRYDYDAAGRLTKQQDFDINQSTARYTQTNTYDDAARSQTLVDRREIPTVRLHDGLGRRVSETRGLGNTLRIESTTYNAAGLAVTRIDPNNHTSRYRYDAAGRLLEETRGVGTPEAVTTRHTYDAVGNLVSTLGPRDPGKPYTNRWTYDDLNRQVRSEDALERVTASAYDATGNLLCVKRPLGHPTMGHGQATGLTVEQIRAQVCTGTHVTRYTYDEVGKLTDVVDALGGHYSFVYDATRNLVAKQDANGNLSTFEFDALGHRIAEHVHLDAHLRLTAAHRTTLPLFEPGAETLSDVGTLTWRSTYDANGNLETFTDAKGQVTASVHRLLDRLASRTYSNHALPRAFPSIEAQSFTYDANGNLTDIIETKRTDANTVVQQHTTHTYDKLDRLESTRLPSNKTLAFTYYAAGQRKSVTDPDNVATSYQYDALDRVSQAIIPGGTIIFKYWPDSLPQTTELPNGLTEQRCYDVAGQLTNIVLAQGAVSEDCTPNGPLRSRFAYSYDLNGNRLRQTETRTQPDTQALASPETTTYGYDALDRLTGVAYPDGRVVLYRLDAVGNRTGERDAPSSVVSSLGPEAFDSVSAGQLSRNTSGTFNRADWLMRLADHLDTSRERQLSYDANGNLSSLISSARTRSFSWDIRNTLTIAHDNDQEVGRYDYDANLQRIWRHTAHENVEYVQDGHFVLQEVDATRLTKRRYHYAQKPLAVSDSTGASTNTRLLSNDVLDSVSLATSLTGEVTTTRQYDAWGNHRSGTGPSAGDFKLGFTGHQLDVETGLTYARARYYDSELGRFMSRDSYEGRLDDAPSLHRYVYAYANPLKWKDITGHDPALTEFGQNIQGTLYEAEISQLSGEQLASLLHAVAYQYRGDHAAEKLQAVLKDREQLQKTVCDYIHCNTSTTGWLFENVKRTFGSASSQTADYLSSLPVVHQVEAVGNQVEEVIEATKESLGETVKGATINAISSKQAAPLGDKFASSMGEAAELETHLFLDAAEGYAEGKLLEGAIVGGGTILGSLMKAETTPAMPRVLKKLEAAAAKESGRVDGVFHVTPQGVALPKGPKYEIPKSYVENPYREGNYGEIIDGKYTERLRIDPGTPTGEKGPNKSHYHINNGKKHYSPAPGEKDPGFK
ncbi:RHS repeat domain-containing protein [Hyalangium gracile]|uniref:RHS repeat domain-containing protein n=1 Tax=Hyalangium gracile TaxID=394092 RepID=UPI001CCF57F4|nr:RHS repeat-associated core domain-containing protein [Hyalangium gracile]